MGRLKVSLCGIELDNPIIPSSGTFGYGYEFAEYYDINILGTFSFKGTTKEPTNPSASKITGYAISLFVPNKETLSGTVPTLKDLRSVREQAFRKVFRRWNRLKIQRGARL